MIAVDWSHVKGLTTFDGEKSRVESQLELLSRIDKMNGCESIVTDKSTIIFQQPNKETVGGESIVTVESNISIQPPVIVLENGAPLQLIYNLMCHGAQVGLIDNHATEEYRKEFNIEKTDENDAKIIYNLANDGHKPTWIAANNKTIQLKDLYNQFQKYQKARIALELMKKSHKRHYGGRESIVGLQSNIYINLSPDYLAYDIAIQTLEAQEHSLLEKLDKAYKPNLLDLLGGESNGSVNSIQILQPPNIKGLGNRIWLGLMITCNPQNFKCLSSYLRFCGLTSDVVKTHKYNRHARMLYHILAESIMKQRDEKYRPMYDKFKEDVEKSHPDYTKGHIHNAALNRTATFLAKDIFYYVKSGESKSDISSNRLFNPPSEEQTVKKANEHFAKVKL